MDSTKANDVRMYAHKTKIQNTKANYPTKSLSGRVNSTCLNNLVQMYDTHLSSLRLSYLQGCTDSSMIGDGGKSESRGCEEACEEEDSGNHCSSILSRIFLDILLDNNCFCSVDACPPCHHHLSSSLAVTHQLFAFRVRSH